MELPQSGGAYTRDEVTGALSPEPNTEPADAGFSLPAPVAEESQIVSKQTTSGRKA